MSAPGAATASGFLTARIQIVGAPAYSATRTSGAVGQNSAVSYQLLRVQGGGSFNLLDGSILFGTGLDPMEQTSGTIPPPAFIDVDFPIVFDAPSNFGLSPDHDRGRQQSGLPTRRCDQCGNEPDEPLLG